MKANDDIFQINVKKDDIDYAVKQDRWGCAIVRAIQRERPEALFVRVDKEQISYSENGHRYYYLTPEQAVTDIIKPFDSGKPISPTTIFITTPPIVRQVNKLTPEKKKVLRSKERIRQTKEKATPPDNRRTHNRFCET